MAYLAHVRCMRRLIEKAVQERNYRLAHGMEDEVNRLIMWVILHRKVSSLYEIRELANEALSINRMKFPRSYG